MHLKHTEEQDALRDAVARFLEKASSAEAVREAEPLGFDPKVWAGLSEMGVPTLGVSEENGGSGASLRDLAVVAEACGARLVPGAAVADAVVALDGDRLVLVDRGGDDRPAEAPRSLGSQPVADVDLAGAGGLPIGPEAVAAHALAVDEWRPLTARWLLGLGREAQAIGIQYAKDRKQFGTAIGSFQAVQHR